MATQPIAPSDIQARTARLKSRTLLSQPKRLTSDKTIRVHRCFSQINGQTKPETCACTERVSYSDALAMSAKGEASWLLIRNPKTTGLVKSKRAVVAETRRERLAEQTKQAKEFKVRLGIQAAILGKFRKFILREFSKGNLPQAIVNISDAELRAYLGNPEHLRTNFSEFAVKRLWEKVVGFSSELWANHTDQSILNESGPYMADAPRGQGKLVTGGYDSAKIDTVAGFDSEDFVKKAQAANFVPREFNGGYIGPGSGPDEFENNQED